MRKPTAKSLILDLLLASKGRPLSAKQAIAACGIFDISVNNTRVALVRLSAEGLIESAGRALYQLTDDAHTLADDVAAWRTRSTRVRPWMAATLWCKPKNCRAARPNNNARVHVPC
ncbi:hypothetical protein [Limnobacter sp. SAORIC-690]|uniref:hypothetical protein n=1 Tax=Limnobacter sp. SAORIC-690 TaxID=1923970 RepID=UPI000CF51155|nr:hypothetical protein [Limnobacter sp. SAORIC-690]